MDFFLGVLSDPIARHTLVHAGMVARDIAEFESAAPVGDVSLWHLVPRLVPRQLGLGVAKGLAAQAHRRSLLHHDLAIGRLRRNSGRN